MRLLEVVRQAAHRNALQVVCGTACAALDEIGHRQERRRVHPVDPAHLLYGLVADPERYVEARHHLQQRRLIADNVADMICLLIYIIIKIEVQINVLILIIIIHWSK